MNENYTLTTELKRIFTHIKNDLLKRYPTNKICIEYFLNAILCDESSVAYQIIEKVTLSESIDILQTSLTTFLTEQIQLLSNKQPLFEECYDLYIQNVFKKYNKVDSGLLLIEVLKNDNKINKTFKGIGISYEQLEKYYNEEFKITEDSDKNKTKQKKHRNDVHFVKSSTQVVTPNNEVEKHLINVNKLAQLEQIDTVIENDGIYSSIFRVLTKQKKNNIVIVGDSGVGKTTIVENIANLINDECVPQPIKNKVLMKLKFTDLLIGSAIRGMLETKIKTIVNDAKKNGNYIIFIDNIQSILDEQNRYGEIDIISILDMFLSEPNIAFICTCNHKTYNKQISKNNILKNRLTKIVLEEPNQEMIEKIVNFRLPFIEHYHDVIFTEDAVQTCINLSQRYITDVSCPNSILDVLDECGAYVNINRKENETLKRLKNELNEIIEEKRIININTTDIKSIDLYDNLSKKEINLKSKINGIEKNDLATKEIIKIDSDIVKTIISERIKVPITDLATNDREKLQNLEQHLKKYVIGQDNAIDKICRVVKRQRIGISDPNKPPVLLFAGTTGTGKTYLTKQITKELFGDEKHLVRLDMSEYIDKTSTNKLIGAGSGYIGYDNGGVLTEAIKKHKHCVLLLDEIEKANEDVHNVFLQLFDEGRLTDNTGEVVDFRHCIIIMTSNVGAKECDERGNGIGFNQNNDFSNEIISKSLKKVFKPEFINRINDIIYFNKLTDDDYRTIIKNEINKIVERIEFLGFGVDETITTTLLPDLLFSKIQNMKQYGARPIVRELQRILEDSITDYIIDNNPDNGFIFSFHNLKV